MTEPSSPRFNRAADPPKWTFHDGEIELVRRLHRIFISPTDQPGSEVDDATLTRFARDLLAADYHDPDWGDRPGDGGPAGFFLTEPMLTEFTREIAESCSNAAMREVRAIMAERGLVPRPQPVLATEDPE